MKKIIFTTLCILAIILFPKSAKADVGDNGFFGGITEGTRLPKTTQLLLDSEVKAKKNASKTLNYKEIIFISGKPVEFEGLLTVKASGGVDDTKTIGTYTVSYVVAPSDTTNKDASISRTIVFTVNYRKENNQVIKDYTVKTWTESIKTPEGTYNLDKKQSYFDISFLEDNTAGVTYYKGNISQKSVFTNGGDGKISLDAMGEVYGYKSAWSATETHRINSVVSDGTSQMQYQVRPSVSVNKTLKYQKNEPTLISFPGNYSEVMQNKSGLQYDIFIKPASSYNIDDKGSAEISTYNTFEQLIAPDLAFLKGHFAEDDIKKLFSMQVLTNEPSFYKPDQAITRGEYVTALVKAAKIPVTPVATTTKKSKKATSTTTFIFPDVKEDRPEYPYIMAAYKSGLIHGKSTGYFYIDDPIERQEAIVMMLRVLGLESLGLDPTPITTFSDDDSVSSWAKREVYAANRIGLIMGNEDGEIRPREKISKAEAAAFINRLIVYMSDGLQTDYTENIVNYSN